MSPIAHRLEDQGDFLRFSVGMNEWRTEVWAREPFADAAILEAVDLMANGRRDGVLH